MIKWQSFVVFYCINGNGQFLKQTNCFEFMFLKVQGMRQNHAASKCKKSHKFKANHFAIFLRLSWPLIQITGPSEAGAGGLQPPNNLPKFVDFVSEKGCNSQGRRKMIPTPIYSRKLPESVKNAISFDVIEV